MHVSLFRLVFVIFISFCYSKVFAAPFLAHPAIGTWELVAHDSARLVLPEGLAFDSFGNLFVTLESPNGLGGVAYVDKNSGAVTQLISGLSRIDGIVRLLNGDFDFLVTSELPPASTSNRLYRIKINYDQNNIPASATAANLTTTLPINNPEGITLIADNDSFGPAGTLLVAEDATPGNIYRVDPTSGATQVFIGAGAQLARPEGLAFGDFNGALPWALYTPESGLGRIRRIEADGTSSVFGDPTSVALANPDGLAFGPDGFLYVAEDTDDDSDRGRIIRIAADGSHTIFAAGLRDPSAVAFDPISGDLYVAEQATSSIWRIRFAASVPLKVTTLHPTASGFEARFNKPVDASVLNLYDNEAQQFGPADVTFVGALTGPVRGSLVVNYSSTAITFVKTGGPLVPDSYTVTLRSAANAFKDLDGQILDGDFDGKSGGDYVTTFTVASPTPVFLSIPDFLYGPGQIINVPYNQTGIPVNLNNGDGITTLALTLAYDPNLLTLTHVDRGVDLLPDSLLLALDTSQPGAMRALFSFPTALKSGAVELLRLQGLVPANAPYKATSRITFNSLTFNDGAIPALADDALQVVAYLGDTTGNKVYSSLDAQRILRVAAGLDSGFTAYPLVDPAIVGDTTWNGSLSSLDATRVLQKVAGLERPEIPAVPPR